MKEGNIDLNTILSNVKSLRAETRRIASKYASEANEAESVAVANELLEAGKLALQELYSEANPLSSCIADVISLHRALCRIPMVELDTPTIVLVGSPNVGKSSLVR